MSQEKYSKAGEKKNLCSARPKDQIRMMKNGNLNMPQVLAAPGTALDIQWRKLLC